MAYPDDDVELIAELAFGADLTQDPATWQWTDLSARVHPEPISIRRGVAVGASNGQTSSGSVVLSNADGHLTPVLATSPYWPYVDAGTPARIRIKVNPFTITDAFTRTVSNGWGTGATGEAWTPLTTATAFATTGTQATVTAAAHSTTHQIMGPTSLRDGDIVFDASIPAVSTGVANIIGPVARYDSTSGDFLWGTVEFGLLGVVQVKLRASYNGAFVDLAQVTCPGVTYTGGTLIRTRMQVVDDRVRMRAWLAAGTEPDVWDIDVYNGYVPGAGLYGMSAGNLVGNTNALPFVFTVDTLSITNPPHDRLEGYIADIRPTFLPQGGGTTWSQVTIDIAGIGSRLEKNQSPAYSPMRRSVQLSGTPPIAYWPLEDGAGSSYGVSAFPGQPPMTVEGPAVFGFAAGVPADQWLTRYGSRPLVSVAAGARLTATVPLSSVTTEWAVHLTAQEYVNDVPAATENRIAQWFTPAGTHNRWALVHTLTGYQIRAYNDDAGTSTNVITTVGSFSTQVTYEIDAVQNGANIDVSFFINSAEYGTGSIVSTAAAVSKVVINPDRLNTTASVTPAGLRFVVGHVSVADDTDGSGVPYYFDDEQDNLLLFADKAWYQESAHRRVRRVCDEEQVPCQVLGQPATTGLTQLGAQQDGSFTELIEAATESESGGLLFEARCGYYYLPRSARYNRDVALTIDLDTYARDEDVAPDAVLVPRLDSRNANQWTVERTGGAEGSYAAPDEYRRRRGTIAEQVTLDVLTDGVTTHHAAWRVHVSVDGRDAYYPEIPIDLAANPALLQAWLSCDIGSRVQRVNQPSVAGYGPIDQIIDGYTETIGPRLWSVVATGSPAKVWDVARADDPVLGKADTDGSELQAVDATSVTLLVDVTAGPRWTTDPAQMPIPVTAGGEDMTVTAISGTSNPQTFTVVRSVNGVVKSHPADTPVSLTNPARAAL